MASRRQARKKQEGDQTFIHYRVQNFTTYIHLTDDEGNVVDSKEIKFENGVFNTSDKDIIEALEAHQDFGVHLLNASAFEQVEYHKARQNIEELIGSSQSDKELDVFLNVESKGD